MSDTIVEQPPVLGAPASVPAARPKRAGAPPREEPIIHEVDGIQEADNQLPTWWLYTLFGAIVFAAAYWFYFQVWGGGLGSVEAYRQDLQAERLAQAARLKGGTVGAAELIALSENPQEVAAGKAIYDQTCVACHGPTAGGTIGPNLTDDAWLHGAAPEDILRTIRVGVPEKGMLAWGPQIGEGRVVSVAAFVLTLKNTNVAGGKPPQGVPE